MVKSIPIALRSNDSRGLRSFGTQTSEKRLYFFELLSSFDILNLATSHLSILFRSLPLQHSLVVFVPSLPSQFDFQKPLVSIY